MKTITVYKYDELTTEAAKTKARDWFQESGFDFDWWDSVYEDAARIAEIFGVEFKQKQSKTVGGSTRFDPAIYFTGFSSQGDGACFEGSYKFTADAGKKIREYAPQDKKLHEIGDALDALQKAHGESLTATVTHNYRYYFAGSTTIETMKGEDYADKETAEALAELLRDFMNWIYRTLEKEYEYLTSDEQIAEAIAANEYHFYADGSRARG